MFYTLLQKPKSLRRPPTTLDWELHCLELLQKHWVTLVAPKVAVLCDPTQKAGANWEAVRIMPYRASQCSEGSDPPARLARWTISRETALCKKTRSSVSNRSYCNKWKFVFQIPVADVQVSTTHMLSCMCTQQLQSTCVLKSDHSTSVQQTWSRLCEPLTCYVHVPQERRS